MKNELQQLDALATILPVIFLAVAAFLVNIVLARLLRLQREQIAALKALGYTNREVGAHYVKFALVIVAVGALLGVALGAYLGRAETTLYTKFFRFPVLSYRLGLGSVLGLGAGQCRLGLAGALIAVRRAVKVPPAEAMRPEPPMVYRPTILERAGFHRLLTPSGRMIRRDLERQPLRTALSAVAVALSVAILVSGRFSLDAVDFVLRQEFQEAQRQHLSVTFLRPVAARDARSLARFPGVLHAELVRTVGVRVRFGHRSREIPLTGLPPSSTLRRLMDDKGRVVSLPREGAIISRKLAEILGANVGDTLDAEILEGTRGHRPLVIAGVIDDYVGLNATMRRTRRAT